MKNSVLKGVLGTLAVAGVAMVAKKVIDRKRFMRDIFSEYGIKERSPFAVADRVREMDDEEYSEFKEKLKEVFPGCNRRPGSCQH